MIYYLFFGLATYTLIIYMDSKSNKSWHHENRLTDPDNVSFFGFLGGLVATVALWPIILLISMYVDYLKKR